MQPFRIDPQLPVEAVKTYSVSAPIATHYRPASCAEVECPNMQHGWRTKIDPSTDLGAAQIRYIEQESGRRYTVEPDPDGLLVYTFAAGQKCFAQHQISLEREPLYVVRGGDWRGNPRGEQTRHTNADDWVDDFANHQQTLADRLERG